VHSRIAQARSDHNGAENEWMKTKREKCGEKDEKCPQAKAHPQDKNAS
jgi:hypothetical protein